MGCLLTLRRRLLVLRGHILLVVGVRMVRCRLRTALLRLLVPRMGAAAAPPRVANTAVALPRPQCQGIT